MGGILRDPVAEPEAKILVDQPRRAVGPLKIGREANRCLSRRTGAGDI